MRFDPTNRLLITVAEWEAAGLTYLMYENARKRNQLEATRAGNGRPAEIYFDTINEDKQQEIHRHFGGNAYTWARQKQATSLLKLPAIIDLQASAHSYYSSYKSPSGKFLPRQPKNYVQLLTEAAGWLELFHMLMERTLPISPGELKAWRANNYEAFCKLLEAKEVKLPYSYTKLTIKRNKFVKGGKRDFTAIIPGTFENTNSKKLKTDDQLILLKQLHGRQNNMYTEKTAFDFNVAAMQLGWTDKDGKPLHITPQTAANYVKRFQHQLTGQRQGINAWRNKFDLVIKRDRPSAPLYMTNHDGWDYERYYYKVVEKKDKSGKLTRTVNYWNRKNVVFVTDAFNNYILGYCISDQESKQSIMIALKNAVDHIKELTGEYALPWQIKCDNFGLSVGKDKKNDLRLFYEAMAYHPDWVSTSEVGNSREKVIENWFEKFNTKFIQEAQDGINWSGRNLGAENQANQDWLQLVHKSFPDEQGVIAQIHNDIARSRATNQAQWLEAWNQLPAEERRIITREQYLQIFGRETAKPKQLTNEGFNPEINGVEYWYIQPSQELFKHIGVPFRLIYDDWDRTSILAVNDELRLQFLVPLHPRIAMAFKDMKEGDRSRLNKLLEFKKEFKGFVQQTNAVELDYIMTRIDAEGVQKMFPTMSGSNKHLLQASSNALKAPLNNNTSTGGGEDYTDLL